jgi:hypothetical protein
MSREVYGFSEARFISADSSPAAALMAEVDRIVREIRIMNMVLRCISIARSFYKK